MLLSGTSVIPVIHRKMSHTLEVNREVWASTEVLNLSLKSTEAFAAYPNCGLTILWILLFLGVLEIVIGQLTAIRKNLKLACVFRGRRRLFLPAKPSFWKYNKSILRVVNRCWHFLLQLCWFWFFLPPSSEFCETVSHVQKRSRLCTLNILHKNIRVCSLQWIFELRSRSLFLKWVQLCRLSLYCQQEESARRFPRIRSLGARCLPFRINSIRKWK